jgi:hypothetical protein
VKIPLGAGATVADAHHPELPILGERADQMKYDAVLRRGVEVQVIGDRDIDQVVRS